MKICDIAVATPDGVYMPYSITHCLFVSNEGDLSLRPNAGHVMGKYLPVEMVLLNYYHSKEEALDLTNKYAKFPTEPGLYSCHDGSKRYMSSFILASGEDVPKLYIEARGVVGSINDLMEHSWTGHTWFFHKVLRGLKFAVTLRGTT